MNPNAGLIRSMPLVGILLLTACAAQPPVSPEALEPLPPPPDALELESAPPVAVESESASALRPTGQTGPGVLPGMAGHRPATLDDGLFERRLQERQKRIHLGLERPQREQDPVDNLIDFDF